ncbi:hypothetical protein ACPPVO_46955 [Dactylosporangium sp. McL0621]|uniref:hypothetical protein n=1 Tax=Dactylosporangium sp. McL0621 TaxID=3415678 RepID=UPI003CF7BAE3
MSTLQERLREEMARSVAGVRAAPDPYGRLLRRSRRRTWRWGASGIGAVVVAALLGTQGLTATSPAPAPAPAPSYFKPSVGLNDWTRGIIAEPTRSRVEPGVAEGLRTALDGARGTWRVDPALDRVKVLLVADTLDRPDPRARRFFGAVFYNAEQAEFVSAWAPVDAPLADLASGRYGRTIGDLSPFTEFGPPDDDNSTVLVPAGCEAKTAVTTTVRPDGTLEHSWAFEAQWKPISGANHLWQVICDGVVRQQSFRNLGARARATSAPPAERGAANDRTARDLLSSCPTVPGLEVGAWRVLWGGTPPGERRPTVVVLGTLYGDAAEVCAATGTGDLLNVSEVHGEPLPAKLRNTARVTTAVAASDRLVVVRLPHEDRGQLSDRLLVVAPPGATRLQVTGGRDALVTLTDGVGVVDAPVPATLSIAALDASGATLVTTGVAEPAGVERFIVGEPLIDDWDK